MNIRKISLIGLAIVVLIGGGFLFVTQKRETTADYKNIAYLIGGERIQLKDGVSELPAQAGSASKIVTRYFGNQVKGDLNADGIPDLAFLLTQTTGGSGTFYYVVGAIQNASGGYSGTDSVFIGDRIAPQTTELSQNPSHKNVIVVNYADRAPGEPMTARPSIGKSIWLKLDPQTMQFGEVVQNFEGEADPSRMTLGMKTWNWINSLYNDGRKITPKKSGKFTLSFSNNGKFSATTDCNRVGGDYTAKDGKILFNNMMSTLMYCEGSQEGEFTNMLGEAQGYHFTSKGELVFDLKFDSGSVIFR